MRWLLAGALLLVGHVALAQSDRQGTLEHQGVERRYVLHMPGAPEAGPRPLVLALHGLDRGDGRQTPVPGGTEPADDLRGEHQPGRATGGT